jgi:hypothetical protein
MSNDVKKTEVKKVESAKPAVKKVEVKVAVKKVAPAKKPTDAQRLALLERKVTALGSKVEKLAAAKAKKK